jgi:uncharacterized protein (DUF779 family)
VRITATDDAVSVVEEVRRLRHGSLVFALGTGCCESTAPFLYEDFWPGPDAEVVGEVAGVPVLAPAHLRALYPGNQGGVIDVERPSTAESFSIETELGARFVLRSVSVAPAGEEAADHE